MTDETEIHDLLGKYATNVIKSCAFGLKLDSMTDEDSEFRKYGRQFNYVEYSNQPLDCLSSTYWE